MGDLRKVVKEELLKYSKLKNKGKKSLKENQDPLMNQIRSGDRSLGGSALAMALAKKDKQKDPKPEYYSPPEVESPYHPKFQNPDAEYYQNNYRDVIEEFSSRNDITAEVHESVRVEKVKNLEFKKNIKPEWHFGEKGKVSEDKASSNSWFGKYPLYAEKQDKHEHSFNSWQKFLEDIVHQGIRRPIQIRVEPNGKACIYEGSHRIEAYNMLGISEIPAIIKWYNGVQGSEDDQLMEIFRGATLNKNASSLSEYFEEMDGISFKSRGEKVKWVDNDFDKPLYPDEAYKKDEYEIGNIR